MNLLDLFRKNKAVPTGHRLSWEDQTRNIGGKLKAMLSSQTIRWGLYLVARLWFKDSGVASEDIDGFLLTAGPAVDWILSGLDVLASFKVITGRLKARNVIRPDGTVVDVSPIVDAPPQDVGAILADLAKGFAPGVSFEPKPRAFHLNDVLGQRPLRRPQTVEEIEASAARPAKKAAKKAAPKKTARK